MQVSSIDRAYNPATMTDPTPSTTAPRPGSRAPYRHVVPPGTHTLGMWLFLATLTVLFVAGMLVYVIVRITGTFERIHPLTRETIAPTAPPLHSIDMPLILWLSTGAILLSSFTMHRALDNVVHERQDRFRQALLTTLLLAVPFFLAQGAGLATLLGRAAAGGTALQNAIVFLIIVHGLHLVGGLIPLAVILKNANAGRYDHEFYTPVKSLAMYWHFLDGVWMVMFATFLVLG